MKNICVDSEGNQRCWNCGGKNCFTLKRTFKSKALFGVGALLTDKKLKCQMCGEYNLTGNAEPFTAAHNQRLAEKLGTAQSGTLAQPVAPIAISQTTAAARDPEEPTTIEEPKKEPGFKVCAHCGKNVFVDDGCCWYCMGTTFRP